jgi:hypothetical protein
MGMDTMRPCFGMQTGLVSTIGDPVNINRPFHLASYMVLAMCLMLPRVSWAEDDSPMFVIGMLADVQIGGATISEYCTPGDTQIFPSDSVVFVVGIKDCQPTYGSSKSFTEIAWRGKTYFVDSEDVVIDEKNKTKMESFGETEWAESRAEGITGSLIVRKNELNKALTAVDAAKSSGLSIIEWALIDESEYTKGTGIRFSVLNPTDKTIKYIWFTVAGINAVDDPVGAPETVKAIGPLEAGASGEYRFEYVWYTDIVETAKIRQIKVQYTDGTQKVIAHPSQIVMDSDDAAVLSE